jgi:nitrate reductase alpha subunit
MDKVGNGGKGIAWNTEHEVELLLKELNGVVHDEGADRRAAKDRDRHRCLRVILMLAPETNGEVAVKAWEALSKPPAAITPIWRCPRRTRRSASAMSSPSRARSSPRRPGRARSEKVCYNAGYTNVHELIPWRTLTGRQQLYQDHLWMRAFGEALCVYRRRSISRPSSR